MPVTLNCLLQSRRLRRRVPPGSTFLISRQNYLAKHADVFTGWGGGYDQNVTHQIPLVDDFSPSHLSLC